MRLSHPLPPQGRRSTGRAAFTMVEIAICLGVIVFAIVAIIGVLPLGMNVQKDNREETIINQDAAILLNALRNGSRGLDDLTNYLVAITNIEYRFDENSVLTEPPLVYGYTVENSTLNGMPSDPQMPLTNGACIIGMLSTPRYLTTNPPGAYYSNYVFADFHAMSGPMSDKFPQKDTNILDYAFRYRVTCEITPVVVMNTSFQVERTVQTNLHDLRLSFRWPVLPNVGPGNNRMSFRTQVAGSIDFETNTLRNLYFLNPNKMTFVPPPSP